MKLSWLSILAIVICLTSCDDIYKRSVTGNGEMGEETRNISSAKKISLEGSLELAIIPGQAPLVKISGDKNLLQYIETKNQGGKLLIKISDDYKLKSTNKIKVEVTTPVLESLDIAGNGKVSTEGKFSGGDKLDVSLAGNSDVSLEINTPSIDISVAGSGDITLKGETKKLDVSIAGSGNFKGEELMTEQASIDVAGSGDVHVNASTTLDADIMGSGSVYYKGAPQIKSNIMGSGKVIKQ